MSRDLRLPSIDGLRAFEAAARLGSFERAADELHVTASAVSKRVAAVEELLGTPLFVRGARALALTTAGRDYLAPVGHVLGLLAAMPQHQRVAAQRPRLRICAPPTFARQILVPALDSFTRDQPGIELELQLTLPQQDLAATDADIDVRFGDASLGQPLLQDTVLPVAAPTLLQRLAPLREPADLAHAPLLRSPLEPWTPWFRAAALPWPEPSAGPMLADLGLLLEAAVAGQGVALGRPTLARHWLASGTLVPVFGVMATPVHPVHPVHPIHRYYLLPHATRGAPAQFARWLHDTCARHERESRDIVSGLA